MSSLFQEKSKSAHLKSCHNYILFEGGDCMQKWEEIPRTSKLVITAVSTRGPKNCPFSFCWTLVRFMKLMVCTNITQNLGLWNLTNHLCFHMFTNERQTTLMQEKRTQIHVCAHNIHLRLLESLTISCIPWTLHHACISIFHCVSRLQ